MGGFFARATRGVGRGRSLGAVALLTVLALSMAVRAVDPSPLAELRMRAFDLFQRTWSPQPPAASVAVVGIGERALERYGQWPWPRTRIAELVRRIHGAGARVVALDMVFAEPDRTSPTALVEAWREVPELAELARRVEALSPPSHDRILAEAIGAGPTVLGTVLDDSAPGTPEAASGRVAVVGPDPAAVPAFAGGLDNLAALRDASDGVGALNLGIYGRATGVVRAVPVVLRTDRGLVPSLAAEAIRVAGPAASHVVRIAASGGVASVRVGGASVPTDAQGRVWPHFRPRGDVPVVDAADVLAGEVPAEALNGRIVFLGPHAAGLGDVRTTPLGTPMPGVEIHAQAAAAMASGAVLRRPGWAPAAEVALTLALGLACLAAQGARPVGPVGFGALAGATVALPIGGSVAAFAWAGLLLDPLWPALTTAAVTAAGVATRYAVAERARRSARRAFGHYLAPAVVEQVAEAPERLDLGTQRRTLSVMFCDLRGFTALAEELDAGTVADTLNRVLTPITDAVMASGGTVDKYIGDAVMAFWNAPLDDPDHAYHALRAALEVRARLADLRAQGDVGAAGRLDVGIGINTGRANVGNMGSRQRFDYSAIGDTVNVAARLETLTKAYKVDALVSQASAGAAPDYAVLPLGVSPVSGRSGAVPVAALVGPPETRSSPAFVELARRHVATAGADNPADAAAAAERCLAHLAAAPVAGAPAGFYEALRQHALAPPGRDDPAVAAWADSVYRAAAAHCTGGRDGDAT